MHESQAKTITGDICGFDFSINQDLSYDVTIKIGGMTDSVKGADLIFGKGVKFDGLEYEDPETEESIIPTDVISALTAASTLNTSQAFAGRARPYSNEIVGSLVTVKHVNDEGGWSNFWGTNRESMDYINLESLVKLINKNVTVGKVFGKIKQISREFYDQINEAAEMEEINTLKKDLGEHTSLDSYIGDPNSGYEKRSSAKVNKKK